MCLVILTGGQQSGRASRKKKMVINNTRSFFSTDLFNLFELIYGIQT